MNKEHHYQLSLRWTGNTGEGTNTYGSYERSHCISMADKPDLFLSSDPAYRGDAAKHNPEDLLLSALASCHMLWFLHLCADAGVVVIDYQDHPIGKMKVMPDGGGQFTDVLLRPKVTIKNASQIKKTNLIHQAANKKCFIARSCNFPVRHEPLCIVA